MSRTLLITNDFPPRPGGIQQFVYNLAIRQPPESLVVYASSWPRHDVAIAKAFDAQQPFPVIRENTSVLLPTPAVGRRAVDLARAHDCQRVWFGAAAPLGLLALRLRHRTSICRALAQTHGHEAGWAAIPGARHLLGRIARGVDVVTYLGEYMRTRLARVVDRRLLHQLAPGVDTGVYHPEVDGTTVRRRYRLSDRPVIVCVSRLVARKGQDLLIKALPLIQRQVPDAVLLIVGGGPDRARLHRLAGGSAGTDVIFTGAIPWEELPAHYAAGDVYAMPCRSRHAGLNIEGLGIVYLEASATGLPVVAGDSGGAPDAVRHGVTGFVVGGHDLSALVDRLALLLTDRHLARQMGQAGRTWVAQQWGWDRQAQRLTTLLTSTPSAIAAHRS